MKTVERITVSLPSETAEHLRELATAGVIDSVSAYVADAVDTKMARDRDLARFDNALAQRGITITAEAHAWAESILDTHTVRVRA